MRHYTSDDFEDQDDFKEGFVQRGKYASRRDIARNGRFQKPKKENHKPRPPRHAENLIIPESF